MLPRTMMDSFMSAQVLMLIQVLFWGSVSCQDPVQGFTGEKKTLPCSFKQPLSQTDKVFWRDTNDFIVLDINGGVPNLENQNEKYKGRVSIIQGGYNNGNVSINLKNLQPDDAGTYTCRLLKDPVLQTVRLIVSERPAIKTGPSDGAAGTTVLSVALLSALSLLLCF